jgi:hypothetical protein
MMLFTWRSSFNSRPSKKSNPGVSITENRTLSKRDSQISTHAVSIAVVAFLPRRTNWSSAARWSTVAVGEMSAVSRRRRNKDVFPVPLPPTTYSLCQSKKVQLLKITCHEIECRRNARSSVTVSAHRWCVRLSILKFFECGTRV